MRTVLISITIIFFIFQVSLTIRNKHFWPFCAYSMFNRVPSTIMVRPKLKLYLSDNTTKIINIHETIPLEFFKAIGIYYTVYEDLGMKNRILFSDLIIKSMNDMKWGQMDEVYKLYNPPNNVKVVDFDLIEYKLDFTNFIDNGKPSVTEGKMVYSTRSQR